ncbi:hypothetical protein N7468_010059 [Penicillium chermesinum]|uniref:Crh-like protein n=1 Tax=Penicillium chermesinum TaxID=63820 RepID=A0A9W9NBZ2_9EURO|nr:uncharacterized protein N7468_010059 [Penicillium chermesinum]KAJ5217051.1 hypothetical protein N7468_010059 [Penicillium chermesinum]
MRSALGVALGLLSLSISASAQTYTSCNPLQNNPALGKADQVFDFTKGSPSAFKATGSVSYDGTNGATFTIAKQGDGPLIQSNWYIMFGKVEYTIKAASGTGIVSSAVLQSDDLDEIDWEWLGGDNNKVQTNYFGKGDTSTYNRGAFSDNPGNHDEFHTYSVDWTSNQIVWAIDGQTVRVLTPSTADPGQYPQTPMMIKVGIWAGGDPSNPQGTIDWAGGVTDYSQGPFQMYMKSMTVTDYSTGTSYSYGDKTGNWQSIIAAGGKVNGNSGEEPTSTESAPAITATVDIPVPWSGTHKETASWVTPDTWPWVPTDGPSSSTSSTGLPAGWESGSRSLQPPGGAFLSETSPEHNLPYISPSSSLPLAFSSDVSSPSGRETTSWKNVTRHATTKTRTRFQHHKTGIQAPAGPTATTNFHSKPTASHAGCNSVLRNPSNIGWTFYAFFSGVFLFL